MQLLGILISLLAGGLLALLCGRYASAAASRWVSLASLLLATLLWLPLWPQASADAPIWLVHTDAVWMQRFGIHILLATDAISSILIGLTLLLGYIALLSAWG
ncbi:MAG: NADH-quinone oxidoreductase subunit M, partial [Gammaproteobacteria bacterium]|nr:NADH-quinone oxidoreductase subunit M [Gammaproteobacteria bacterium]